VNSLQNNNVRKTMIKLLLTMAAGSALLLVSCEPIPIHPDHRRPRPNPYGEQEQPQPDRPDGQGEIINPPTEHPVAQRTANPNHVISPFSPFNVINVEGFRSGQLAKDPSNGKIFRIP
jgi:hypothetical protein